MRLVMCVWALVWLHAGALAAADSYQERVARVTSMPGLVAFWDFTKREAPGGRFTAHVPADAASEVLARSWQTFVMTFDAGTRALTGWLDGRSGDRWLENPKKNRLMSHVANAWLQGRLARIPGRQPGEDPEFPVDQHYNPPEDTPVAVTRLEEQGSERVELREYPYTKVKVTLLDGRETDRELVALRLNPWFFPHAIYTPKNDGTGGPFTIGRVIHSHRTVGFTGWIGGVAVFDRALSAAELGRLHALAASPLVEAQ